MAMSSVFSVSLIWIPILISPSFGEPLQCFSNTITTLGPSVQPQKVSCSEPSDKQPILACLVIRYHNQTSTEFNLSTITTTDFACDLQHVCNHGNSSLVQSNTWTPGLKYKGWKAMLYCCENSGCNDPRAVGLAVPKREIFCHSGWKNNSFTDVQSASCNTGRCFNVTQGGATVYGCDSTEQCSDKNQTDSCRQIPGDGQGKKLCCCELTLCNIATREAPQTLAPMPRGLLPTDKPRFTLNSVGLACGLVIFCLVMLAVVIVTVRWWRRQQHGRIMFSHTQLTADMVDNI